MPSRMSRQIQVSRCLGVGSRYGSVDQFEKSRSPRPCLTSRAISHETGEIRVYHTHRVSPEWQS